MSKNVFWVVAQLPQRLKSTFFEIFSHSAGPFFGTTPFKIFFQKTLIFAFEANTALSRENETKIVKIARGTWMEHMVFLKTESLKIQLTESITN